MDDEEAQAKFDRVVKEIEALVDNLHMALNIMDNRGLRFDLAGWNGLKKTMDAIYASISRLSPAAREIVLPYYAGLSARLPLYSPDRTTN